MSMTLVRSIHPLVLKESTQPLGWVPSPATPYRVYVLCPGLDTPVSQTHQVLTFARDQFGGILWAGVVRVWADRVRLEEAQDANQDDSFPVVYGQRGALERANRSSYYRARALGVSGKSLATWCRLTGEGVTPPAALPDRAEISQENVINMTRADNLKVCS